jgi:ankyrin repeat protein
MTWLENQKLNPRTLYETQGPLCTAAAVGNVDTLRELLKTKGVNIDVKGCYGRTPLMWACAIGNYECIKLLVDHNANVHAHDYGTYALELLIRSVQNTKYHTELTREKLVRLLIDKGAKVNMNSHNIDDSVLWTAIRADHIEVVSVLLHAGANPSVVLYDNEKTPLTHAIRKGDKKLFDLLMRYNVDVNQGKRQRNHENMGLFYPGLRSPLGIAVECGDNKMVIDLFAKGAKMTPNEILDTALVATRVNDVDGKSTYNEEEEETQAISAKEYREKQMESSPQIV